jgi:hypothetical protein
MIGLDITCREVVGLVTDYLESALPVRERVRLEQHLIVCEGCANYADQMQMTVRLTGLAALDEFPAARKRDLIRRLTNPGGESA